MVETPGGRLVEIVEVRGNSCRKGDDFARQEHVDPRRTVTTTVAIDGARWPRLPVRTNGAVPKANCTIAISRVLDGVPGFESLPMTWFPKRMMEGFADLQGVQTRRVTDDDADENHGVLLVQAGDARLR